MAAGKTNKTRQLIGKYDHQMLGVSQASDFKEIVNSLKEINISTYNDKYLMFQDIKEIQPLSEDQATPQTLVNIVSEYHIEMNYFEDQNTILSGSDKSYE